MLKKITIGVFLLLLVSSCSLNNSSYENKNTLTPGFSGQILTNEDINTGNPSKDPPSAEIIPVNID